MKTEGTQKPYQLYDFVRLEDEVIRRFRFFSESDPDWNGDYGPWGIEGALRDLYNAYDKASGNAHGIALESFHAELTLENMNRYIEACNEAVDYGYKMRAEKDNGLILK